MSGVQQYSSTVLLYIWLVRIVSGAVRSPCPSVHYTAVTPLQPLFALHDSVTRSIYVHIEHRSLVIGHQLITLVGFPLPLPKDSCSTS